jgi:hypothetical protein
MITTSNTIKGHDLALHLAQHAEPSCITKNDDVSLSSLFLIEYENVDMEDHPWYQDIIYYFQYECCPDNLENHERRRLHLEASKYLILGTMLFL